MSSRLAQADSGQEASEDTAGSLLECLMHTRCLPTRRLRWVQNPADLPVRLQQIVCLLGSDKVWRAYTDDSQWWFAASSAEPDAEGWTLKADFFSEDGVLCGAGSWRYRPKTGFVLTGIFEIHASDSGTLPQFEHAAWQ